MTLAAFIGQTGKLETTGNHIDTLGSAFTGYRTAASAVTAGDLADADEKTLTIYSGTGGTPTANCLMWRATWDNANSRWTRVSELVSFGTISDEDDVSVFVVNGVPDVPVSTGGDTYALVNGAWSNTISGVTVTDWIDTLQTGAAATYSAANGQTVKVTLTASGTINLTTPTLSAGESVSFTVILIPATYTPTFNVNSASVTKSVTLPTWTSGNYYALSFFVDSSESMITGVSEMT